MNTIKLNLLAIIIMSCLIGCGSDENKTAGDNSETKKEQTETNASDQGEVIMIQLPTMQCSMCKKTIERDLKKLDGVNEVNVVVKEKVAKVTYDKSKTDVNSIEGVIVAAGYQANDKPADKEAYEKLDDCCKIGAHD